MDEVRIGSKRIPFPVCTGRCGALVVSYLLPVEMDEVDEPLYATHTNILCTQFYQNDFFLSSVDHIFYFSTQYLEFGGSWPMSDVEWVFEGVTFGYYDSFYVQNGIELAHNYTYTIDF